MDAALVMTYVDGIEVVFLNRPLGKSPEDDLLLQVQGMVAEYERAKIMEYVDNLGAYSIPSEREGCTLRASSARKAKVKVNVKVM
jgi:hypothetical protein